MQNFILYHLCHPDTDEIRYVGITKNGLKNRLNSHLKTPTNTNIKCWFDELKRENKTPKIKEVKKCDTYYDLLISEINEIKTLRENGFNLLNILDGGNANPMLGRKHSDLSKKSISLKNKGRILSEKNKQIIKDNLLKRWNDPDYRKKMSEKNLGDKNPFYGKTHNEKSIEKLKLRVKNCGGFLDKNNPNFKYEIPKKTLYEQYIIENKTIKELSLIYNCSINTINNNLRKYKLFKPKSNIYGLDVIKISNYLKEGYNYVQIGEKFKCSNKIIYKFVKKHNLYVK